MKNENRQPHRAHHTDILGRCKVCTKQIRADEDHAKVFHGGNYYLVCCASCAAKFEANPPAYLVV